MIRGGNVEQRLTMKTNLTRRQALGSLAVVCGGTMAFDAFAAAGKGYRLATFSAEVTPPLGHPLMGGGIAHASVVVDPLFANGLVLLGFGAPLVLVSVDWCEIRNDAYDRWRIVLAEAAGTTMERVLVTSTHVHDTPIADLEAERILKQHQKVGSICMLEFHEQAVRRGAAALRESLGKAQRITHVGTGQAKVSRVASNRRYVGTDGKPAFDRGSATRDAALRELPEGTIDPWLKTLSFWDGDRAVAALHCYATHPMSYYGKGGVSDDFVGLARRRRLADDPKVFQIYVSGCSGNVTAGKFNDGSPENRAVLAERMYQAMSTAWKTTERRPIKTLDFRIVPLRLEPRNAPHLTVAGLNQRLSSDPRPFGQCLAALGLSWRKRADAGGKIDLPVLDFGFAQLLLLPGESYVEYQLLAQQLRPDAFVMVMGYGESATGYIPTEQAFTEGDTNLNDWCWVAPGSEAAMTAALKAALQPVR